MSRENFPNHPEDDPVVIDTGGLNLDDPAAIARIGGSVLEPMTQKEFDAARARLDAEIAAQEKRNSGNA